ncbi:MAG: hypothetical protein Q9212_003225 [Teloschistes hypoglaucus]
MASPDPHPSADAASTRNNEQSSSTAPPRPTGTLTNTQSTQASISISESATGKKRRNHRGGKRKKSRRQSFAPTNEENEAADQGRSNNDLADAQPSSSTRPPGYRLGTIHPCVPVATADWVKTCMQIEQTNPIMTLAPNTARPTLTSSHLIPAIIIDTSAQVVRIHPLVARLIDIDGDGAGHYPGSTPASPRKEAIDHRRHTIANAPEDDVCYPLEGMSEMGEDDYMSHDQSHAEHGPRRRRIRKWPDIGVLDEWSREEKEERSEGIRAKKISEPVLIGGRLRPQKYGWHRAEEDAPYRFTYFNEEFPSTIHSQTISELLQPGQSFEELFIPDRPELSSDDSSEDDESASRQGTNDRHAFSPSNQSKAGTRHPSLNGDPRDFKHQASDRSGTATPQQAPGPDTREKTKRYGARPTFWLDVLSPTDTEMRVISKTFGIHPLTAEDIMMQEAREKVELFRHYYFVNYRTFEQDTSSENYLEPVNMYVVVFREGVISFHFSMSPHPANVRRRIRQLKDYLILSSDWISYAIIDDITDVFAPLIQSIEEEVDDIDDQILQLHSPSKPDQDPEKSKHNEKTSDSGEPTLTESGGDMLRRVGEGRKKVMGLYRLLGNKADVIKGFAKRCNEFWEVAPRSEIGLYLGDIQDHILTMTSNLNHYETLLSRAHSNYLAQINIRMNERQEQTADVLGKLTVLGTIVLPMNIITGMWGMNVLVPGQTVDNLYWFWSSKNISHPLLV